VILLAKSNKQRVLELELKLGAKKVEAVTYMLEKQMAPPKERLTNDVIAEKLGISERTLDYWKKEDDFIELKNLYAEAYMRDEIPNVHAVLLRSIKASQPSMKAVEMFYKLFSMLNDKQVIEDATASTPRDDNAINESLKELDGLLGGDGDNDGVDK
jgi:hypothetical protein